MNPAKTPADRGSADAYYGREFYPHFINEAGQIIPIEDMQSPEWKAYGDAYWKTVDMNDTKDWGYHDEPVSMVRDEP